MADLTILNATGERLDPVTVFMTDIEPGRGSIIVECFGLAWTCYWGGMGSVSTVRQFLASIDSSYLAFCLIRGRGQFPTNQRTHKREVEYLTRIAEAVINAAKAAPEPPR